MILLTLRAAVFAIHGLKTLLLHQTISPIQVLRCDVGHIAATATLYY